MAHNYRHVHNYPPFSFRSEGFSENLQTYIIFIAMGGHGYAHGHAHCQLSHVHISGGSGSGTERDPGCCSAHWISIIGFVAILTSFIFSFILLLAVGFDVSNYEPPAENLEGRTKTLMYVSFAIPFLAGPAAIVIAATLVKCRELCRFYHYAMPLVFVAVAGILLGVGGDIFTMRLNIAPLVHPYRVLWTTGDSVWAGEVEKDFECCDWDATTPPRADLPCNRSLPFCSPEITRKFDRNVKGLALPALVIGAVDAVVAILWTIVASRQRFRHGAQVDSQVEPPQEGKETGVGSAGERYDRAQTLSSPESPSTPCQEAVPPPYPGGKSPLCEEAVLSPYSEPALRPPAYDSRGSCES
jgi:hypothetical protein